MIKLLWMVGIGFEHVGMKISEDLGLILLWWSGEGGGLGRFWWAGEGGGLIEFSLFYILDVKTTRTLLHKWISFKKHLEDTKWSNIKSFSFLFNLCWKGDMIVQLGNNTKQHIMKGQSKFSLVLIKVNFINYRKKLYFNIYIYIY